MGKENSGRKRKEIGLERLFMNRLCVQNQEGHQATGKQDTRKG